MKSNTIFLVGEIGSGKDYIADALQPYGFNKLGVGNLIADELEDINGLSRGTIYSSSETKAAWRERLQEHGNLRRAQDGAYWIKKWWQQRTTEDNKHHGMVFSSCRFVAEGIFGMAKGALVVRVVTPTHLRRTRAMEIYPGYDPKVELNASEGEVSMVPYHFQMHGTYHKEIIFMIMRELERFWSLAGRPVVNAPTKAV